MMAPLHPMNTKYKNKVQVSLNQTNLLAKKEGGQMTLWMTMSYFMTKLCNQTIPFKLKNMISVHNHSHSYLCKKRRTM